MLLEIRPPPGEAAPWWRSPRLAGAALVVAVHVLFVSFLLTSLQLGTLPLTSAREMFLLFRTAPKPVRLPRQIVRSGTGQKPLPLFRYAPSTAITILPETKNGLSLSLFGCAPENLANLTPDQRAHCGEALNSASLAADFPGAPHDLSLNPGRWKQAMRERNMPVRVPCTYIEQVVVNGITGETRPDAMVDPFCVLGHLAGAAQ